MGYGNIDALTKPIDILFALVHSTTLFIEFVPFLFSGMYQVFSFSSLLHLHFH